VNQGVEEAPRCGSPRGLSTEGYFYPPTLFTDVSRLRPSRRSRSSASARVDDVPYAARSRRARQQHAYGLAASVWTENINLALDVAPKLKAGVVWVNCTNQFDAASGFGGYRESASAARRA